MRVWTDAAIAVLSFSDISKTACDINSTHESVSMWFFPRSIQELAKVAPSHQETTDRKNSQPRGRLAIYLHVATYLLKTNASEDVIAEAENDITIFKQLSSVTAVYYSKAL